MSIKEQSEKIKQEYSEVQSQLSNPEIVSDAKKIAPLALARQINFCYMEHNNISIALNETTSLYLFWKALG